MAGLNLGAGASLLLENEIVISIVLNSNSIANAFALVDIEGYNKSHW